MSIEQHETSSIPAFPPLPREMESGLHEEILPPLRAWADNTTDDLREGVDDQATYLLALPEPRPWLTDGCRADTWAKDFLGRVMDYKRARLASLVPHVGMRLRVDAEMNRGAYFVLGSVVEVIHDVENGTYYTARGTTLYENNEGHRVDDTQSMRVALLRGYHQVDPSTPVGVEGSGPEPEVESVGAQLVADAELRDTVAALNQRITDLEADKARLTEQLARAGEEARANRLRHEEDAGKISEALIRQAVRRSWCSEYDEFVDELNGDLHVQLELRRRDISVEVSGYIRVPYCITVTVETDDPDDTDNIEQMAAELVSENYTTSNLVSSYSDTYNAEIEDDMEFSIQ